MLSYCTTYSEINSSVSKWRGESRRWLPSLMTHVLETEPTLRNCFRASIHMPCTSVWVWHGSQSTARGRGSEPTPQVSVPCAPFTAKVQNLKKQKIANVEKHVETSEPSLSTQETVKCECKNSWQFRSVALSCGPALILQLCSQEQWKHSTQH